jgi:hypothetical protein
MNIIGRLVCSVAMFGANVDLDKSRGVWNKFPIYFHFICFLKVLEIQLRIPCCLAKIYSSGRVTVNYCKRLVMIDKSSQRIDLQRRRL